MKTLVIQSYKEVGVESWITQCMGSVKSWANTQGYDYRFVGDEIFSLVPNWYLEKVQDKLAIATDYARLILLQEALSSRKYDLVIWFDADTLIFDVSLILNFENSCAFGQEVWIQKEGNKYRAVKNVHNAVCAFKHSCPTLPFLIQTVESIIRRVDPTKIPPQMVGPKLLTALHNIAGFSLLPEVGALSPELAIDVIAGEGEALKLLKIKSQIPLKAVNMCASIIEDNIAAKAIQKLMSNNLFKVD